VTAGTECRSPGRVTGWKGALSDCQSLQGRVFSA
jgi:hypothetical protein